MASVGKSRVLNVPYQAQPTGITCQSTCLSMMAMYIEQQVLYENLHDEATAVEHIVKFIDGGMPVLVSVSHARVAAHIILVVGYENYQPNQSSLDFRLVVHDPYGRFDPTLLSTTFGKHRFDGGMSLLSGGAAGPGRAVRLPVTSVSRQRAKDAHKGTFYLLSARR